jgi:hypothetical protein
VLVPSAAVVLSVLMAADEPEPRPGAIPSAAPSLAIGNRVERVEEPLRRPEVLEALVGALIEVRSGRPAATVDGYSLTQIEIDPLIGVSGPIRSLRITAIYDPRIFVIANESPPQEGKTVAYLHRGRLVLDGPASHRTRVYFNGLFAYGDNDFLPLTSPLTPGASTGQPPAQPGTTPVAPVPSPGTPRLPDQRFLRVIDLDASAGVVDELSQRLQWRASAGYRYTGGGDVEARTSLPLQKGPRGAIGLVWSGSPNDTWTVLLDAFDARFSNGPHSTIANLSLSWTHSWSRELGTDLVAGVTGAHSDIPEQAGVPGRVESSVHPLGGLGLRYTVLGRHSFWRNGISVLAAPLPDPITGLVVQRVGGLAVSALSPTTGLTFEVTGGGAVSVDGTQQDGRVEGRVTYQPVAEVSFSIGARMAWLGGASSTLLGPSGFGWLAFATVSASFGTPPSGGLP